MVDNATILYMIYDGNVILRSKVSLIHVAFVCVKKS
jgi:hypothetical protein